MKKLQLGLIILLFCVGSFAQITQRNLLSSKFSSEMVKANLIRQNDWKPFQKLLKSGKRRCLKISEIL